jgi:hypothetical protein
MIFVMILFASGCATSETLLQEDLNSRQEFEEALPVMSEQPLFRASLMAGTLEDTRIESMTSQQTSGFAEDMIQPHTEEMILAVEQSIAEAVQQTHEDFKELTEQHDDLQESPDLVEQEVETAAPMVKPEAGGLVIRAIGTGLTENEARSDALSALAGTLYSQVSSSMEIQERISQLDDKEIGNFSSFSEEINVSSNLPILGASYSTLPQTIYDANRQVFLFQVEAVMKGSSSLPLYETELDSLHAQIYSAEQGFPLDTDSLEQEKFLESLLALYSDFDKLAYVSKALGAKTIPSLPSSRYAVEAQLRRLEGVVDSYAKAARNLTRMVEHSGVYLYPAKLNNSGGISEFAEQLAFSMGEALGSKVVFDAKRAGYYLFGSYTLKNDGKDGIYVTYRLENTQGRVVSTSAVELPPSVYHGQRFMPVAYDFQKQLERGDSVDSSFLVDIRMNGMKDYLSFHKGDELTIEVKVSEPGFFYVVGYVFNELGEKFSYLFPLSLDASGKDMFVRRVSSEEVNRWIIINPTYRGKIMPIEVIEPFGVEMLQVYASTERDYQKFLDTVPGFRTTRDYYLVADDPEEGLQMTRALNIKRVAEEASGEIKRSEAFVSFKSGK